MPYTNKATVTHNGNGCTISGTLLGSKQIVGSTYDYQTTNFSITVNSWYENSDGNGSRAQGEQIVLNSPQGSLGWIEWFNTDSGKAAIDFQLYDDGYYYNPSGVGLNRGLTN